MRLNHHHLYIFWIFSRFESFSRTAEYLAIAQSAVTTQIKSLEDHLNISLIDRSHPKLPRLTTEGHQVAQYAQNIFNASEELVQWAQKGTELTHQTIRVGAIAGLSKNVTYDFISPLLKSDHTKVEIKTGEFENLVEQLEYNKIDILLSSRNTTHQKHDFVVRIIHTSPLIIVDNDIGKTSSKNSDKDGIIIPGPQFEARPELNLFLENYLKGFKVKGEFDDIALLRVAALHSGLPVIIPEVGIRSEIKNRSVRKIKTIKDIKQNYYALMRSGVAHQRITQLVFKP